MVKYKRIDVEFNRKEMCPYCLKRETKKRTCGRPECQYKHHICTMRNRRMTKQTRSTRIKI